MTQVFAAVILIVIGFIAIIQGQCYVDEVTGESVCAVYTKWKSDGGKDDISWASDCAIDIEGNDLKTVPNVSDYAKCGELCFQYGWGPASYGSPSAWNRDGSCHPPSGCCCCFRSSHRVHRRKGGSLGDARRRTELRSSLPV